MAADTSSSAQQRMLPGDSAGAITPTTPPSRQLSDLPRDDLALLAEEIGLAPARFRTRPHLVAATHDGRHAIAGMDREALLDVIKWGRRPVPVNATKEQLAREIVRIQSMKFAGLSQRGLIVLARLRGVKIKPNDDIPALTRRLKKQEGIFAR